MACGGGEINDDEFTFQSLFWTELQEKIMTSDIFISLSLLHDRVVCYVRP